ncbi:MAG: hypothetical protein C4519_00470 [Desulfobacteraceae bacterium]|nr:MAG: hypothetical protein C4519_00470 [Desulfobacteraceae bacterium]
MSTQRKLSKGELDQIPWQIKIGRAAWLFDMNIATFKRYVRPHVPYARYGVIEYYTIEGLQEFWRNNLINPSTDSDKAEQTFKDRVAAAVMKTRRVMAR